MEANDGAHPQPLLEAEQYQMSEKKSPVLRVIIENNNRTEIPLSTILDDILGVFKKYSGGEVKKIINYEWGHTNPPPATTVNNVHLLIEMSDDIVAEVAKFNLNATYLYAGCCPLRIQFSMEQTELTVRFNDWKSRDYQLHPPTGLPLLPGASTFSPMQQFGINASSIQFAQTNPGNASSSAEVGYYISNSPKPNFNQMTMHPGHSCSAIQLTPSNPSNASHTVGTVLFLKNLNKDEITPNILFALVGCYADVKRVTMYGTVAYVEITNQPPGNKVMTYLRGINLLGKELEITKYTNLVKMLRAGEDVLTQDYTPSDLHRYKIPGSKNYMNVCPPSKTLHLSNIPAEITEPEIVAAFRKKCSVVRFKYIGSSQQMGLIETPSIEDGVLGLVKMHGYKLSPCYKLRVSFSKYPF